ncbi:MAG: hypothetical protein KDB26_04765 [Microthrixaceae bacterium]|nr:hypothetical protein [Microthrixaceae bacterium]
MTRAQLRDQLLDADITNSERDIPEPLQEVWEDITDRVKVILDWNTQGKSLGASTFLVEMESKKLIDAAREQWLDIARMYLDALDGEGGFEELHAALDAAGIEYEIIGKCNWCGVRPADTDPEMDGCCDEDCRYHLARDEGWVSDAEHAANLLEGWVPA